jgi:hypothetical protein
MTNEEAGEQINTGTQFRSNSDLLKAKQNECIKYAQKYLV